MTSLGLVVKNALRNKFRTILTIVGVALAIVAFIFLRTVVSAWYTAAEHSAKDRIGTRHKLSFVISLPKRYVEVIRGEEGVVAATWASWTGHRDPRDPNNFFGVFAVDPESYLDVYDEMEVTPEEQQSWFEERRGALVGDVLARKLGVEVGDTMTLEGTIFPGDYEYVVSGIYRASRRSVDRSQFLIHWEYFNETLPERERDQVGWIVARVDEPDRSADISTAIDRRFDVDEVPTITMSERAMNTSFMGMLSAILTAIDVISLVVLFILLLILGNTISMGVRERQNELGVLRAIGFVPRQIVGFILGEAITVGALAGVLGLALGYVLVELGMGRFIEENFGAWFPYFRIEITTYAAAMALAIGLALVAAAIPAWRTSRTSVTEALRRVA